MRFRDYSNYNSILGSSSHLHPAFLILALVVQLRGKRESSFPRFVLMKSKRPPSAKPCHFIRLLPPAQYSPELQSNSLCFINICFKRTCLASSSKTKMQFDHKHTWQDATFTVSLHLLQSLFSLQVEKCFFLSPNH